ncbi:hypothetical protein [Streptomyces sp. NPDC056723]|uniref:hypothetical protein n=1 Tax=Streptomyces sp. NPDC056723 TaxID=3345925 RepID=UPI00369A0002
MADRERDPDSERYAYSRTALARLAFSAELRELADRAAARVPTTNDCWSHPGEPVGDAFDLVKQAQEALTRAVIYERQKGTSWEAIAEQLDIKKQSAHERYKDAVEEWKLGLVEPFYPPSRPDEKIRSLRLHDAAYTPTAAGRRLDAWARERGQGEHAVTGALPALTTAEEMVQVLDGINHLYGDGRKPADPAARARLTDRKAALLERIAVEDGNPQAAVQAAEARALAAQLRTEAEKARAEAEGEL